MLCGRGTINLCKTQKITSTQPLSSIHYTLYIVVVILYPLSIVFTTISEIRYLLYLHHFSEAAPARTHLPGGRYTHPHTASAKSRQ